MWPANTMFVDWTMGVQTACQSTRLERYIRIAITLTAHSYAACITGAIQLLPVH